MNPERITAIAADTDFMEFVEQRRIFLTKKVMHSKGIESREAHLAEFNALNKFITSMKTAGKIKDE